MFLTVVRHEWRQMSAGKILWPVAVLFALLVGYGVWNGLHWVHFQQQTLEAVAQEETGRIAKMRAGVVEAWATGAITDPSEPDPRSAGFLGTRAARNATLPPGSLAALAIGQSDLYPYYFRVTMANKVSFTNNDELENPTNQMAGHFDLAFVVVYLYPLFILALSYNLLSAERDEGTLAMLMSQPLALGTLVLAKIAARGAVVVALAAGFSLLAVLLSDAGLSEAQVWLRLALWITLLVAYGGFWFALAIAVGALGKSSATNALALVGLWLVMALVIPALVNVAVTAADPMPSRLELIAAARQATLEADKESKARLGQYHKDHPELVPKGSGYNVADSYVKYVLSLDTEEKRLAPILDRFDEQLARQQASVAQLRFLSPALLAAEALNDLAGTGVERFRHFGRQVDGHHRAWRGYFLPRLFAKANLSAAELDRAPRYTFFEEDTAAVAARTFPVLAGLVLPTLLLGAFGLVGLRRFPLIA